LVRGFWIVLVAGSGLVVAGVLALVFVPFTTGGWFSHYARAGQDFAYVGGTEWFYPLTSPRIIALIVIVVGLVVFSAALGWWTGQRATNRSSL
jgi:hypothetical protein